MGVMARESGSWKIALIQLGISNVAAYALTVVVVQILKSFGL